MAPVYLLAVPQQPRPITMLGAFPEPNENHHQLCQQGREEQMDDTEAPKQPSRSWSDGLTDSFHFRHGCGEILIHNGEVNFAVLPEGLAHTVAFFVRGESALELSLGSGASVVVSQPLRQGRDAWRPHPDHHRRQESQ